MANIKNFRGSGVHLAILFSGTLLAVLVGTLVPPTVARLSVPANTLVIMVGAIVLPPFLLTIKSRWMLVVGL